MAFQIGDKVAIEGTITHIEYNRIYPIVVAIGESPNTKTMTFTLDGKVAQADMFTTLTKILPIVVPFYVGQRVGYLSQKGTVIDITDCDKYPVRVQLDDQYTATISFTLDGRQFMSDTKRSLFSICQPT